MFYMINGTGRVLTESDIKMMHKNAPVPVGAISIDYGIFRESLNLVEVTKVRGFWVSIEKYTNEDGFNYEQAAHDVRIGTPEKKEIEQTPNILIKPKKITRKNK